MCENNKPLFKETSTVSVSLKLINQMGNVLRREDRQTL